MPWITHHELSEHYIKTWATSKYMLFAWLAIQGKILPAEQLLAGAGPKNYFSPHHACNPWQQPIMCCFTAISP